MFDTASFDADLFVDRMIASGYATKTAVIYRRVLIAADRWAIDNGTRLDTIDAATLRKYAETLPRSHSSRASLRSALRIHWSLTARYDGPLGAVRVPRKRRTTCRALDPGTSASLERIARARRDRKGLAVLIGLYAGLRRAEIAGLRYSDIGNDDWLTIEGKGNIIREFPLHPVVVEALRAHRAAGSIGPVRSQDAGFVFPGRWGGGANPATVWGWVREVSVAGGLDPIATHVLRHTALTNALDATRDLRAVQEIAGHASPETTAGYTRSTRRRITEAVLAIDYSGGAA